MIVKFLLPQSDEDVRTKATMFKTDGSVSLTSDRMHFGLVRQVAEENDKISIVADITEPDAVKWINDHIGEGGPDRDIVIWGHLLGEGRRIPLPSVLIEPPQRSLEA